MSLVFVWRWFQFREETKYKANFLFSLLVVFVGGLVIAPKFLEKEISIFSVILLIISYFGVNMIVHMCFMFHECQNDKTNTLIHFRNWDDWDNWRAYGPELQSKNQQITDPTYNKTCCADVYVFSAVYDISLYYTVSLTLEGMAPYPRPLQLRTCMNTERVISGTTGGLMDPNYCYKISWSLTRLIIKLAGQTYKSTSFQL